MGPVGAGKSALTEHVKQSLELAEPIYHLDGCPIKRRTSSLDTQEA